MTTRKEADAQALWPEGTDVDGLRVMCVGIVANVIRTIAIYIGTANARSIVCDLAKDERMWGELAEVAPRIREQLKEMDEQGKKLDEQEEQNWN